MKHLTREGIAAGLAELLASPKDEAVVELIVCRPAVGERRVLEEARLDLVVRLVGDNWAVRGSSRMVGGEAHPHMQLNLMSSRVIGLLAGSKERWPLAGDQFYFDLDLSEANLPPGSRLHLGEAVIEITDQPHTGCDKFVERFGVEAMRLVSSDLGKANRLRGVNARVLEAGVVRLGDRVVRVRSGTESGTNPSLS
jgi:hypothetical protein